MIRRRSTAEVMLEQERSNRALAEQGWGPILRLKFVRSTFPTVLVLGFVGEVLSWVLR